MNLTITDDEAAASTGVDEPLNLVLDPERINENLGISTVTATLVRSYREAVVLTVQAIAKGSGNG